MNTSITNNENKRYRKDKFLALIQKKNDRSIDNLSEEMTHLLNSIN
jgi:hypothetical protein